MKTMFGFCAAAAEKTKSDAMNAVRIFILVLGFAVGDGGAMAFVDAG
jgi:hypothetical protein